MKTCAAALLRASDLRPLGRRRAGSYHDPKLYVCYIEVHGQLGKYHG